MHAHNYVYEKVEMEKRHGKVRFFLANCAQGLQMLNLLKKKKKLEKETYCLCKTKLFSISNGLTFTVLLQNGMHVFNLLFT